jgi:hypothetical protein
MSHECRYCFQTLTIDNIYPSDLKYHNWICKSCSNIKKRERKHKHNQSKVEPPQLNTQYPKPFEHTSHSTANHLRNVFHDNLTQLKVEPQTISICSNCKAYQPEDSTCHLNPPNPYFPRVSPYDYCEQIIITN